MRPIEYENSQHFIFLNLQMDPLSLYITLGGNGLPGQIDINILA
jgi:hypothetical protein